MDVGDRVMSGAITEQAVEAKAERRPSSCRAKNCSIIMYRKQSYFQVYTMPNYDYFCEANDKTVAVCHDINSKLKTWSEICFAAQIPLGDTDALAPVRLVIRPVAISVPISNSQLKEHGFTKLVKRDNGVYENVTATDGEKSYMKASDKSSLPHLHKKISS